MLLEFRVPPKTVVGYLFATKRLFFVYRSADRGVNLGRSVLMHAGQDVAVEVERYSALEWPTCSCATLG